MKRHIFLTLSLFISMIVVAQEGQPSSINTELPHSAPPSPSVANLMKFEEYPVNNYTGIPDISIPIYSVTATDNALSISLGLSYHPAAASGDAIASNTGLGWSLMAGGSISRTVRGLADERFDGSHYGIRRSENQYEQILAMTGNVSPGASYNTYWGYLWEANYKGKYDTEYDLYQYNFMGQSGRFIINKALEVVKLDNSILKITYVQSTDSFVINDDKGNSYYFDVKETSTEQVNTSNLPIGSGGTTPSYVSAYHLSKVVSKTARPLITFGYSTGESETVTRKTTTRAEMLDDNINDVISTIDDNCVDPITARKQLEPTTSTTVSQVTSTCRRLTSIIITDKAKIEFVNVAGRSDYNLDSNNASTLKEIVISRYINSITSEEIKRFTLGYFYSNVPNYGKRLMLGSLTETAFNDPKPLKHLLSYNNYYQLLNLSTIGQDYWGYFNSIAEDVYNKETSKLLCKTDILQKIVYPSGGCALFDFEPNSYSYEGYKPVTDFTTNPDNWIKGPVTNIELSSGQSAGVPFLSSLGEISKTVIEPITVSPNSALRLKHGSTQSPQYIGICSDDSCLPVSYFGNTLTNTSVVYQSLEVNGGYGSFIWYTLTYNKPERKWLYGGGVRIKRIGYFTDGTVDQNYYNDPDIPLESPAPVKEKNYGYNFFNDAWRSSGALVSQRPVFEYVRNRKHGIVLCGGNFPVPLKESYRYKFITSKAGGQGLQTQGGYVNYKNVSVSETGNGKMEYTYDSPIDVTEDDPQISFPFVPKATHDYKKGNLQSQVIYDNNSRRLVETQYSYDPSQMLESTVVTGMQILTNINCPFSGNYATLAAYLTANNNCQPNNMATCPYVCGFPESFLGTFLINEFLGWKKLTGKTTKEYFYTSPTATATTVETAELYQYNNLNHNISHTEKTVYSGSAPETLSTDYEYYLTPGYVTNNRISDILQIKNYRNGELIDTKKINYNTSAYYLPASIAEAKGSRTLENKVEFSQYDAYGRPLMMKQTGGITVSYIYGYNKSQLIAKIENATYQQIATALSITVDNLLAYTEANITTLNSLRTLLPTAMVTTYTYKPLVGILTNTDPRGYTTSYEYDAFGRLIAVKDAAGNLLSENKYNYRP